MKLRISLGSGSPRRSGGQDVLVAGLAIVAFGALAAGSGFADDQADLAMIGLLMIAGGAWVAGLHRLVRKRQPALSIPGGLLAGGSVVGATAALLHDRWGWTLPAAVTLYVGLLLLGVLAVPRGLRRVGEVLLPFGPGLAFVAAGVGIVAQVLVSTPDEGVPRAAPVVAGLVFVCAGVVVMLVQAGRTGGLAYQTLIALLITGLATVSVVFPPSLLFTVPVAVLAWIAVARLAIEKVTGRDPLAAWSQERVVALGCAITVALALLAAGGVGLHACLARPPLPAEAPLQPGPHS